MPPGLDHRYVIAPFRHKVDVVRRAIHATDAQRVLIFMNFQQRIKDTEAKVFSFSPAGIRISTCRPQIAAGNHVESDACMVSPAGDPGDAGGWAPWRADSNAEAQHPSG